MLLKSCKTSYSTADRSPPFKVIILSSAVFIWYFISCVITYLHCAYFHDLCLPVCFDVEKPGRHSLKPAERCHLRHWSCHGTSDCPVHWYKTSSACGHALSSSALCAHVFLKAQSHCMRPWRVYYIQFCLLVLFAWKSLFYRVILTVTEMTEFMRNNTCRHRFATFIHFTATTALLVWVWYNSMSTLPHPFCSFPCAVTCSFMNLEVGKVNICNPNKQTCLCLIEITFL